MPATRTAAALLAACLATAAERPNVVVILADDLGWGDPACQGTGSLVPTPNLDRLAAEGMRFTQAYCPVSVCSPSRYALLTGRYPWRARSAPGVLANWEGPMIDAGRLTLPGLLRQAGYATVGYGKWHLGATWTTSDGKPPQGRGNFKGSGANLRLDAPLADGPLTRGFTDWYGFICSSEQLIVAGDRVCGRLDTPTYAPPAAAGAAALPSTTVSDYLGVVFDRGVDWIAAKHAGPYLLYLAPYVPHIPLAVPDAFKGTTKAGEYGDYVHALDHQIGRVLKALDDAGATRDTLVLFASDNGSQWEKTGAGHRPNGPLRGAKWTPYEGGVRTPLFVRWPGQVANGAVSERIVGLNDVLATMAAVTGQAVPAAMAEDSISFLPVLRGRPQEHKRSDIVVRASQGGVFGLRQEQWKWIAFGDGKDALYNLADDPAEQHDLAQAQPAVAARLRQRLTEIRAAKPGR